MAKCEDSFVCFILNLKYLFHRVSVRLGEHDRNTKEDCYMFDTERICADPVQDIDVEKIIPHAAFDRLKHNKNDIGLIRLARAAEIKGTS